MCWCSESLFWPAKSTSTNCPALTQAHAQRSTLCSLIPTPKPGPPEACFPWGQASTSDSALLHPWCPGNNKRDNDDKNNKSKLLYSPYLLSATFLSTLPISTPLIFTATLESRYFADHHVVGGERTFREFTWCAQGHTAWKSGSKGSEASLWLWDLRPYSDISWHTPIFLGASVYSSLKWRWQQLPNYWVTVRSKWEWVTELLYKL